MTLNSKSTLVIIVFVLGSWFDKKTVLEEAKNMWKEMSEELRVDYGEDYFEYKVRTLPEYMPQPVRTYDVTANLRK